MPIVFLYKLQSVKCIKYVVNKLSLLTFYQNLTINLRYFYHSSDEVNPTFAYYIYAFFQPVLYGAYQVIQLNAPRPSHSFPVPE